MPPALEHMRDAGFEERNGTGRYAEEVYRLSGLDAGTTTAGAIAVARTFPLFPAPGSPHPSGIPEDSVRAQMLSGTIAYITIRYGRRGGGFAVASRTYTETFEDRIEIPYIVALFTAAPPGGGLSLVLTAKSRMHDRGGGRLIYQDVVDGGVTAELVDRKQAENRGKLYYIEDHPYVFRGASSHLSSTNQRVVRSEFVTTGSVRPFVLDALEPGSLVVSALPPLGEYVIDSLNPSDGTRAVVPEDIYEEGEVLPWRP